MLPGIPPIILVRVSQVAGHLRTCAQDIDDRGWLEWQGLLRTWLACFRRQAGRPGHPAAWTVAVVWTALLIATARVEPAAAQTITDLFPPGVPGYGAAPGVTVQSRLRPEYEPLGIHTGAFTIRPQLEEGVGYDSDVNAVGKGSPALTTRPALGVNGEWSDTNLGVYTSLDDRRYFDQPSQDETNWIVSSGLTHDFGRDTLTAAASHIYSHQTAADLGALPSTTPVPFQADDVRVNYAVPINRLTVTPGFEYTGFRYFGSANFVGSTPLPGFPAGVPVTVSQSQSYRDRNVFQETVTFRYALDSLRQAVVVLRTLQANFINPQPGGQPSQNGNAYVALSGIESDYNGVWSARVLAGVEVRTFSASQFPTHTAPVIEAQLAWTPRPRTTVTATLVRTIEDAAQEGASGFVQTVGTVAVDHELRHNLLLNAYASGQVAQYLPAGGTQGGGTQAGLITGFGVTWLVNRNVRLGATYDFSAQQAGQPVSVATPGLTTSSYRRSIGLLTLHFAL